MATKRASRDYPIKRGKYPPTVSDRDIQIYRHLLEVKYGSTDDLLALTGGELTNFQQRLAQLTAWNFLERSEKQRHNKHRLACPCIHNIGPAGLEQMRERGYTDSAPHGSNSFPHDVLASRAYAFLKIGAKNHGVNFDCLGYTSFMDVKFTIRGKSTTKDVYADTPAFRIGKYETRGIEADANTEPPRRLRSDGTNIEEKLLADLALIESKRYKEAGLNSCYVPYIFCRFDRMQRIRKLLSDITNGYGSRYILFNHFPRFDDDIAWPRPTDNLFTQNWQRVGGAPFSFLSS